MFQYKQCKLRNGSFVKFDCTRPELLPSFVSTIPFRAQCDVLTADQGGTDRPSRQNT